MEIELAELPVEHLLRNIPLLGMYYYSLDSKVKNKIRPAYTIAKKTYNDLGPTWTNTERFVYVEASD